MAYKPKPGTGGLFINKNKPNKRAPDLTGKFTHLDGVEYNIAAWLQEPDTKDKYYTLVIQPIGASLRNDTELLK